MTVLADCGPWLSYPCNLRKTGSRTKVGPCTNSLFLKGFESALQPHAARAFQKDDVAFAEVLLEPDAGLAGAFDKLCGNALGARAFDDLRGETTDTNDTIKPRHLLARGAVQRGAFGT